MLYRDYKNLYSDYKKVWNSYNSNDKTIIVTVPDDFEYKLPVLEKWNEIKISKNNVSFFKNRVLIKLPNKSNYKKWELWVSSKLIRYHGEMIVLRCKDDFEFIIKRKGYEPLKLNTEDLFEVFNIPFADMEYPELHIPEVLKPVTPIVLEELRDD